MEFEMKVKKSNLRLKRRRLGPVKKSPGRAELVQGLP